MLIGNKEKSVLRTNSEEYRKHLNDLDKYYSTKKLGSFFESGKTVFRLFAPQAEKTLLVTFTSASDSAGQTYDMIKDKDGVWETSIDGDKTGLLYGYKVFNDSANYYNPNLCIDPYSKAVASYNTYYSPRKSVVVNESNFDWEGDKWIQRKWSDLIIYEMHIKDQTAHPSSGAKQPGTYMGLTEKGIKGGIDYIKSLGVNTVELLPAQEFANIEIPYKDSVRGRYNNWNPYERNHWGYMTAAFFAPEAYYCHSDKEIQWNKWEGESAEQINAFKNLVKNFHKEGIAVMMDVVYNHISEYEIGNLKEIDKEYYFRLNDKGNFISESGCGNDFKTERPMARRMILESILYWMQEYHVDGFRFDLGKLIDWETLETILHEAQKINPKVVFVAEPWGGGYDPKGFSLRGWGSWNDQIRNGIKGENPYNGLGWIFGHWQGDNNFERIRSYVNGTLITDQNGLFQRKEHSVNYLESHDDLSFGDFVRIATKEVDPNRIIKNVDSNAVLSPLQLKLNKLGAAFLLTSQGITMIHAGQEFARSQVVSFNSPVNDTTKGRIDHNAYNKDNETNYINYNHADLNKELVDYYRGLIAIRNKFSAFRNAEYEDIKFFQLENNPFGLGYTVDYSGDKFVVLFNAGQERESEFNLPEGEWEVLANFKSAGTNAIGVITDKAVIPATSCLILKRK